MVLMVPEVVVEEKDDSNEVEGDLRGDFGLFWSFRGSPAVDVVAGDLCAVLLLAVAGRRCLSSRWTLAVNGVWLWSMRFAISFTRPGCFETGKAGLERTLFRAGCGRSAGAKTGWVVLLGWPRAPGTESVVGAGASDILAVSPAAAVSRPYGSWPSSDTLLEASNSSSCGPLRLGLSTMGGVDDRW